MADKSITTSLNDSSPEKTIQVIRNGQTIKLNIDVDKLVYGDVVLGSNQTMILFNLQGEKLLHLLDGSRFFIQLDSNGHLISTLADVQAESSDAFSIIDYQDLQLQSSHLVTDFELVTPENESKNQTQQEAENTQQEQENQESSSIWNHQQIEALFIKHDNHIQAVTSGFELDPLIQTDTNTLTPTATSIATSNLQQLPPSFTVSTQQATEDGKAVNGNLIATDPNADAFVFSTQNQVDGFSIKTDGTFTFDPSAATYQSLAQGVHLSIDIPITVTDTTGLASTQNLKVVVTGTNDNPVIGSVAATTVAEGSTAFTGQLTSTDVDATDTATYSTTSTQAGFSLKADGSYTVDPTDAAFDHLAVGEHQTLIIPVTATDNNGGTSTTNIEVTITGTNDAPVVSSAVTLPVGTEDTSVTLTSAQLLAHASDVDHGEITQLSVHNVSTDHGNVAFNPDGTFTFTPDKDYNGQVHFTYDVQDPHGASTQATAIMDLAAVGDAAVIGGVDTGSVTEATAGADMSPDYAQPGVSTLNREPLYADGKLTISDPDAGEAAFDTKGVGYSYHGQYGDLILQQNGVWHYKADAGHLAVSGGRPTTRGTAIDELGEGQSLTDTITVYAKDGTAHDIVITIHGSNDRPYCASEVVLQSGTEDTSQTLTTTQLLANTVDVDANDAGKLSIANLRADHGSVGDNGDGTFTFTPARDYNGAVHFNFDVQDVHGGVTHTGATTSLAAVGDAATFSGDDSSGVIEDKDPSRGVSDPKLTATGHLNVIDADAGESNFGFRGTHSSAADQFGGNLRIDQHGTWHYSVSNSAVQHLSDGQQVQVTHTIHSADGTPHDIVITITGTNDIPVISSPVTLASGTEDTDVTIHASDLLAHASDVDTQDVGHLSVHDLQSNHGTITDNHDGTFTLHPAKDYNGKVDFTYDVQDPQGGSTAATATMNLAAVGDAAVITAVGKTLKEDVDADGHHSLNATGHFQVVDADGAVESQFATDASGVDISYTGSLGGTLQIYADGGYFYGLNNYLVDHLKDGEEAKDQFTIRSADGTTEQVEFTIRGTNDAPYIDGNRMLYTVFEGGGMLRGQFSGIDPDHGDAQHLSYSTTASIPGFTLKGDGSYTFDPANKAYDHVSLSRGYDERIIIPITVTDPDGLQTTQDLRINMIPGNDAPVVSSAVTLASGSEDHSVIIHERDLLAHASDVDDYDQLSVTSLHADHGTLVDNHNHTYTFTPDANYNGQVSFSYQVQDNHGASTSARATMNLAAVADASVIAGQDSANATEDTNIQSGKLEASGQLTIVDPDAGEDHFISQTRSTGTGTFDLKSDGSWTYSADNSQHAIQSLAAGETFVDRFLAVSPDGGHHRVEVTVTGTNDVPTISAAVALHLATEDTDVTIHANDLLANATDADDNDRLSVQNLHADHGTITDNLNGTYTFSPDKDYNGKVTFSYDVQDGHGGSTAATASLNLAAVADKAVVSGDSTGSITEDFHAQGDADHTIFFTGVLTATDPDAGEDHFQANRHVRALSDPYGGNLDMTSGGVWQYTVSNDRLQHLAAGQQEQVSYRVYAADGTAQDITITITGTNDVPVLQAQIQSVAEDGSLLSGQMTATDVDTGDIQSFSATNPPAGFVLKSDGRYTFDPTDQAYQHLAAGQTEAVRIPVTVTDSAGATATQYLEVTVTGTNDAPVVSSAVTLPVGTEDTSVTLTSAQLLAHASDVDHGEITQLSVHNVSTDHGNVAFNPDGTFTFTPDKDYNGQVHFTYDVQDPHGASTQATAIMDLAAVGDAAVIGGVDTGSVTEATAGADMSPDYAQPGVSTLNREPLYADGKLTISDPDAGEAAFDTKGVGYSYHGQYGDLILQQNGVWHYKADAGHLAVSGGRPTTRGTAIDELGEGQSLTDTITVYAKDGTAHDIVITIHGSNDRPYCASEVVLQSGTEDTSQTLTTTQLLANTVDVDANDAGKLSIANLRADHGSVGDNGDGTFTFTPARDYNGAVHFNFDVQDVHGGVTHTGATTSLAAVGDAATFSGDDSSGVIEDKDPSRGVSDPKLTATGHLNVIDADAGESNFGFRGTHSSAADQFGGNLRIDQHGTWHYSVSNSAVQHLSDGQQVQVTHTIHSADGTPHDIDITITGTNDAPVVSSSVALTAGTEDTDVTFTAAQLLAHASDVDHGETKLLSVHDVHADHGTVVDNGDGTFTFHPEANYNGAVSFTYDVQDPQGASTATSATMNLSAVDDPSTFTGKDQDTLKEDQSMWGHLLETNQNQLDLTDPDTGKVLLVPTGASSVASSTDTGSWVSGSLGVGEFILHADGRWLYKAGNNDPRVQALGDGKPLVETLQVQGQDGSVHTLTATIHGSNDAPTVSSSVTLNAGTEDTAVTLTSAQLLAHASDVDTGESAQLSVHNLSADHGQIADNHDGTFTFTPDPNYNGPVSFTYDVQDPQGASVATSATIDLASVADTPILSVDITDTADNVLNASEVTSASITGKLDPGVASTLDSIDISDGTTSSSIDASRVSVAADGSYSVSGLDLSAFKDGMLTITAHATSHDGTTATSTDTIVKDTSAHASIVLDPITGDNIINTAESQQQNIAVTGSVTGDYKDGDMVTVSVGSQQYQAAVDGQGHFSVDVPESEFEVAASSGTGVRAEITVTDDAGNTDTVSAITPVVFNLIPQPATLTGESGVHSTVYHATLTVQGAAGQWGIQDHTGHSTTTMAGHYGMLSVNAQTGELTYDARTYSGVQKSGTPDTGTHTEHFVITMGGQQNAQVEVLVELSGQSTHGHSGHFVQKVEVLDMNSAPVSQHDEPDQDTDQMDSVTLFADADDHDGSSSSDDPVLDFGGVDKLLEAVGSQDLLSAANADLTAELSASLQAAIDSSPDRTDTLSTPASNSTENTLETDLLNLIEQLPKSEATVNKAFDADQAAVQAADNQASESTDSHDFDPDALKAQDNSDGNDGTGLKNS